MKIYQQVKKMRSALLVFLTHQMALPILKLVRKPERFPYSAGELLAFPVNSLGHDLINFLHQKELNLLPYYARHDIKHILLGYDTTDEGEVCLQCFMLGNGHISFPVAATVLYGLVTMPEYWGSFGKAFARGKMSIPIAHWNWFGILAEPTANLKKLIRKRRNGSTP